MTPKSLLSHSILHPEQSINIVKELCDEDVTEPEEAKFECEISIPSVKPPKWSLRGEVLQAGRNIIMQQEGTIHRLTILKTSADMTGTIQFSIGKSKSTANLLVRGNVVMSWLELYRERSSLSVPGK